MATIWMSSFDWDGFQSILAQPPGELASSLAQRLRSKSVPYSLSRSDLPRGEAELAEYIRDLLTSPNWYAGKSVQESQTIDGIIDDLFDREIRLEPLKREPLSDGVTFEILEIANGRAEVDQARMSEKSRNLYVKRIDRAEVDDSSELAELGSRPFRHDSWNRQRVEEQRKRHNPFLEGAETVHVPDYSIHSPDQVERLRQDLVRVGDRVRRHLELLKSKRLRAESLVNFEDDLVAPIEKAAAARLAVYARQDY